MANLKIKEIKIKHFRGITSEIILAFEQRGIINSLLLYGDNGSGKSSIVDALELSLTGKINDKKLQRALISYENLDEGACVETRLSDDTLVMAELSYELNENGNRKLKKNALGKESFLKAPFILRRSDILTFWSTDAIARLRVFLTLDNIIQREQKSSKIAYLEQKYENLTSKRKENLHCLCEFFGLKELEIVRMDDFLSKYAKKFRRTFFATRQEKRIFAIGKATQSVEEKIRTVKKDLAKAKSFEHLDGTRLAPLREKLSKISSSVTKAFLKLSDNTDYVEKVVLEIGKLSVVSLSFNVVLKNRITTNPQSIFSEANQDLLALLIYLEFTYSTQDEGQAKVLILDDVFQSIDSTIRFKIMQYILERFQDWQIIITTHDRLWKEQVQQLFKTRSLQVKTLEIKNWSFDDGPSIKESLNMYDEKLAKSIEHDSSVEICASAGYLLEYICENLSISLSCSVHRKKGDKYTIGDLWPGIFKLCKKSLRKDVFENLNDLYCLRNLAGCHYNEWCLTLSLKEAKAFGKAVLDVFNVVFDKEKNQWITCVEDLDGKTD